MPKYEIPPPGVVNAMRLLGSGAADDEIRKGTEGLHEHERMLIEALLQIRAGRESEGFEFLRDCVGSPVPGVASMAQNLLEAPEEPPKAVDFAPTKDLDRVIGWIRWVATEAPSHDPIAEGEQFVRLGDVRVRVFPKPADDPDRGDMISRTIPVGDLFALGFSVGQSPDRALQSGFGLTGTRREVDSFSWEWFRIDAADHATKLQETGELRIKAVENQWGGDIIETEFLTDVSHRVGRFGVDPPMAPQWRLNILKGSAITWPSLIDGEIVSNC